jgi:hypothetical protein
LDNLKEIAQRMNAKIKIEAGTDFTHYVKFIFQCRITLRGSSRSSLDESFDSSKFDSKHEFTVEKLRTSTTFLATKQI